MNSYGTHIIAEYYSCDKKRLDDIELIERIMNRAAELAKVTIVKPFFHQFSPQGVSGVVVIAESHLSIHTWPEHGYAAVDFFSCGDFDYKSALYYIERELKSERKILSSVERGEYFEGEKPLLKAVE